jgi:hypothetical protein
VAASIIVLRSLLDEVDDVIEEECGPPPSLQGS